MVGTRVVEGLACLAAIASCFETLPSPSRRSGPRIAIFASFEECKGRTEATFAELQKIGTLCVHLGERSSSCSPAHHLLGSSVLQKLSLHTVLPSP